MTAIKAFIFDMGKVIIDFDHGIAINNLAAMAKVDPNKVHEFFFTSGIFKASHRGDVNGHQFHGAFCDTFITDTPYEDFIVAACDIFQARPKVETVLSRLANAGYKLILLSNVNEIEMNFIRSKFDFLKHFQAEVLSYRERCVKPEDTIYLRALTAAETEPHHCLFIDDMIENVLAAQRLAIQTHHYTDFDGFSQTIQKVAGV